MSTPTRYYPGVVGLLLGVVQVGYFLQLSLNMSSSFSTYLLVTLCWLIGSGLGAVWLHRLPVPTNGYLVLLLVAYGVCAALVTAAPFDAQMRLIYGALVIISGVYPGVFFARLGKTHHAQSLFFMENNGFIAGLVIATLAFLVIGRVALWGLPVVLCAVLFLIAPLPIHPTPETA